MSRLAQAILVAALAAFLATSARAQCYPGLVCPERDDSRPSFGGSESKKITRPQSLKSEIDGNYTATYVCNGNVLSMLDLTMVDGGRLEGVFTWEDANNGRL
jgi:hypothetical protein